MGYIKKFTGLFVLLLLIQTYTHAQRVHPDSTIIDNDHLSFGVGLSVRQAKITNNIDPSYGLITTRPAIGYHASFFYLVQMGRTTAVEAGIKTGMQAWHYRMETSPNQNPHVTRPISHNNIIYTLDAELPIRVIGRHMVSKKLMLYGFGGASLNFFKPVNNTEVVRDDQFEVFEAEYEVPGNNPYVNLQLGLGAIRRTFGYPVKFTLMAGIPLEKRERNVFEADLFIKDPNNAAPGDADLKSRGTYFGLEISYVLPLRNTWEIMYPEY